MLFRSSPFSTLQGMKMKDPIPQFSDITSKLNNLGLAFLHFVESRIKGNMDVKGSEGLDPFLRLFNRPVIIAGGFLPDTAKELVDEEHPDKDIVVGFGRYFISTPDLVFRLRKGLELNEYNRDKFYIPKSKDGYIDYPFSPEFTVSASA